MELKIVSRSDVSRPDFSKYDKELLATGNFSDVRLECGSKTYNLHKSIICNRCVWFRRALTGSYKEAKTNVVCLTTFSPEQVDIMVCYLYTGTLNIPSEIPTNDLLKLLVDFVVVADYFLLDAECHSAVLERMRWSLNGGGTKRRWPDFVEAVEHAYGLELVDNETPRLMEARKVLIDWYNEKHETARKKMGPGAFAFLTQVPPFALDVLLARDRDENK
ncbi:uncharacterized protein PG998_010764 [Apiospora kogelbergensis]|uniref:BTB domain-containing protein n=1 Tax=Apiospora kogelbergensis TaxID=1337665 RepID=A0AAW0RDH7_9PEZI